MALAVTVLPTLPSHSKWIRFFDFPRSQVAFVLAVLAGTAVWAWGLNEEGIAFTIALLAALGYQFYWIYPFTPLARKEVKRSQPADRSRSIRLMIYNVRMENRKARAFLDRVAECEPDMILANEVDAWWVGQIDALSARFPYQVLQPQANTYGMALYSRLELADVRVEFQVEKDIPSIHCTVLLPDGSAVAFHGIHPKPPDLKNDTEARDAELVLTGIQIKNEDRPAFIAGDLNDVAWSRTTRLFKRLSGMLDPRRGRGFFNTYSVFIPLFRYPLDHLFITRHFQLVELRRLPACGSDHFPVLAELEFVPEEKMEQPAEYADGNDLKQAAQIVVNAREAKAEGKIS